MISDAGVNIAAATSIGAGERPELHILVPMLRLRTGCRVALAFVEKQRCQRAVMPLVRCAGGWGLSRGDASNLRVSV